MQEIEVELDPDLLPREFVADVAIHRMDGDAVDYVTGPPFEVLRDAVEGAAAIRGARSRLRAPGSAWSEVRARRTLTVAQYSDGSAAHPEEIGT